MKWSEMTPRERDAAVAQHVMGWAHDEVWLGEFERVFNTDVPRYTTDISAAWEVVEKMQPHVVSFKYFREQSRVRADLSLPRHKVEIGYGTNEAEAIAKAALKAVGVDVE